MKKLFSILILCFCMASLRADPATWVNTWLGTNPAGSMIVGVGSDSTGAMGGVIQPYIWINGSTQAGNLAMNPAWMMYADSGFIMPATNGAISGATLNTISLVVGGASASSLTNYRCKYYAVWGGINDATGMTTIGQADTLWNGTLLAIWNTIAGYATNRGGTLLAGDIFPSGLANSNVINELNTLKTAWVATKPAVINMPSHNWVTLSSDTNTLAAIYWDGSGERTHFNQVGGKRVDTSMLNFVYQLNGDIYTGFTKFR